MEGQTPLQEIAERVAEGAPGMVVARHLAAIDEVRRNQRAFRQRVADDHRAQMQALGQEASMVTDDEDMGHLIVTGDIYGNNSDKILQALVGGQAPAEQPPQEPSQPPAPDSPPVQPPQAGLPTWAKAAIVAAGLAGAGGLGAAIPWMLGAYSKSTTNVSLEDGRNMTDIEVIRGGALK